MFVEVELPDLEYVKGTSPPQFRHFPLDGAVVELYTKPDGTVGADVRIPAPAD